MFNASKKILRREEGSVVVEFAFFGTILATLLVGSIDLGLAYSREMEMENAVRSGTQFALARRPNVGPTNPDEEEALISLNEVRNAVLASTPFLDADPGASQLSVDVTCECTNGTTTQCYASSTITPTCQWDVAVMTVSMRLPYDLLLSFPGLPDQLTIDARHSVVIGVSNTSASSSP